MLRRHGAKFVAAYMYFVAAAGLAVQLAFVPELSRAIPRDLAGQLTFMPDVWRTVAPGLLPQLSFMSGLWQSPCRASSSWV